MGGVAVDGCGAPAFAVSLLGLARAFAALAVAPAGCHAGRRRDAGVPRLIGGTGRAVCELTAAVPGLVCKEGAEGVWAAALPDGRAFAAKIDDGGMRALPPLLAAALRYWGVDNEVVGAVGGRAGARRRRTGGRHHLLVRARGLLGLIRPPRLPLIRRRNHAAGAIASTRGKADRTTNGTGRVSDPPRSGRAGLT